MKVNTAPDLKNNTNLNDFRLIDTGDKITPVKLNPLTPDKLTEKEEAIIERNYQAQRKKDILQECRNINKKLKRKLTRSEKQKFLAKIDKRYPFLTREEHALINDKLIGQRKSTEKRKAPKGFRWHKDLHCFVMLHDGEKEEDFDTGVNEVF